MTASEVWEKAREQLVKQRQLVIEALAKGYERGGTEDNIDLLLKIADRMEGKTICPLADADVMPIRSFVTKFRSEFEALCAS